MRKPTLGLAWALTILALPTVAGGDAEGQLASDAPVELHGSLTAEASPVVLHHYAFRDASLSGTVLQGRLFDDVVFHPLPDQARPCDQAEGQHDRPLLLTVNATQAVAHSATIELAQGALARILAPQGLRLNIGTDAGDEQNARPVVSMGPNPYRYEHQQVPPDAPVHDRFAPAFPTGETLLSPHASITTLSAFTLEVHWGQLRVDQSSDSFAFTAGLQSATRTVTVSPPSPLPPNEIECQGIETHVLLFDQELAAIEIDQSDPQRPRDFWAGAAQGTAFSQDELAAPEGYWDRARPDDYAGALEALHLPATSLSGPGLHVAVSGEARFEHAVGGVTIDGALHRAENLPVTLAGSFRLEPKAASEDGRQLTTQITGDVTAADWGAAAPGEGLDRFAPLALAAGSIGFLGVAYYAWPTFKLGATKVALTPLYARLKKEDILENPLRDDILEAVGRAPGISASELGRRLSCGWGTLVYHLTVLERMQLISSAREGRHRRFFVQGRINYSDKAAAGLLANPAAGVILDAVRDSPGLNQRDLGRRIGLTAGTIAWHVERMEAAGLLVKEQDGRAVRYYPSSKLLELTRQLAA